MKTYVNLASLAMCRLRALTTGVALRDTSKGLGDHRKRPWNGKGRGADSSLAEEPQNSILRVGTYACVIRRPPNSEPSQRDSSQG